MKHKFTIELETDTCIKGKEVIQQIVLVNTNTPNSEELVRRVCDTSEKELRDALIKLGWTPPEDKANKLEDNEHF